MNTAIRPQAPAIAPDHIRRHHWQEWIDSAVDPGIISLNVRSLVDLETSIGGDVEAPIHDLLNWDYKRYSRQAKDSLRGWWVSGEAPVFKGKDFAGWESAGWGRFKPDSDTPIIDLTKSAKKGYQVSAKYLSPRGEGTSRVTFLRVPADIWLKISMRFGVDIGNHKHFWLWVQANNLPIVLTEGEKKAAAVLTQGIPAIALPGFRSAARTIDKAYQLHPDIKIFATKSRKIYICFDHETDNRKTKEISQETEKLSRLFSRAGSTPFRIDLPGPAKGVDDFIMAQGDEAFERLFFNALPLDSHKRFTALPYRPDLIIDRRYIGDVNIPPGAKLIGIKSPKGSGKTYWLKQRVAQAHATGQKVLLVTHRIQLGQAICKALPGLAWVDDAPLTQTAWDDQGIIGIGICLDSMHAESKAKFDPAEWEDALIIFDESEQALWHLITASTNVKKYRTAITENLKSLLQQVLLSNLGQVICLDADLSLSLECIKSLAGLERLRPWVCVNQHKPQSWHVVRYDEHRPNQWINDLLRAVERGEKVYITTQAKQVQSKTAAINIEALLLRACPDLKILRIDADSASEPGHPAQGCIEHLNEMLHNYDAVISTPVIETGLSIDEALKITPGDQPLTLRYASGRVGESKQVIKGGQVMAIDNATAFVSVAGGVVSCTIEMRSDAITLAMVTAADGKITEIEDLRDSAEVFSLFDGVWGVSFGVSGENQFRQALARVRDCVPRYVWAAKTSTIGTIGNKSTTPQALLQPQIALAIKSLEWCNYTVNGDLRFYPEVLNYWAKWGAALNACLQNYREYLFEALSEEGHKITEAIVTKDTNVADLLTEVRNENNERENAETVAADDVDERRFKELSDKRALTREERRTLRKAEIKRKYRVEATEDLLLLDQKKWHPKIQLHYYLEQGRDHLKSREQAITENATKNDQVWMLDLNKASIANKIQILDHFRLRDILAIDKQFSNAKGPEGTPEHLIQNVVANLREHKWEVRDILGFMPVEDAVSEASGDVLDKSICVLRQLLGLIGVKLSYEGRFGSRNNRRRYYSIEPLEDNRNEVFAAWLERDAELARAKAEYGPDFDQDF
jgi:hypothetical protein